MKGSRRGAALAGSASLMLHQRSPEPIITMHAKAASHARAARRARPANSCSKFCTECCDGGLFASAARLVAFGFIGSALALTQLPSSKRPRATFHTDEVLWVMWATARMATASHVLREYSELRRNSRPGERG